MDTCVVGSDPLRFDWIRLPAVVATAAWLITSALTVDAQINRSRPPDPPKSGSGSSTSSGSRTQPPPAHPADSGSTATANPGRGRTPPIADRGTGTGSSAADKLNGTDRAGTTSTDRFNRSKEGAASRTPNGRSNPFLYFPYFPGGYGGNDPYGYPGGGGGYPYPYPPDPYPAPRRSHIDDTRVNSPYFYCDDLTAGKYVSGRTVIAAPPKVIYVPTPTYRDGKIAEWRDLGVKDYMQDRNAESSAYRVGEKDAARDPALEDAIRDIVLSWQNRDIEPLSRHLRRDQNVAIVLRDKYRYSLEGGDFLDVTQDALNSVSTARFVLDHIHRKAGGIYTLTGRHLFTDKDKDERAAYMSYALMKMDEVYIITQVGSASGREP